METVNNLVSSIIHAADAYYRGEPYMSDEAFDELVADLRILDPDNPILTTDGWGSQSITTDLPVIEHPVKFRRGLDFSKVDPYEILDLSGKYVTLKYDGASVSVYYDEDGNLESAITRNDGITGIDVTDKLRYLVPNHIDLPIRAITGEFILSKEINESTIHSESPRNAASGFLLRKSYEVSDLVQYDFVAYRIMSILDTPAGEEFKATLLEDRTMINKSLETLGFRSARVVYGSSQDIYHDHYADLSKPVAFHSYEADGIVIDSGISIDSDGLISYIDEYAYKIINEVATVTVTAVEWNHTRTNRIVPKICYEPVRLSGAMCSHATGFNAKFIKDNGISKGAVIKITRSGEVIPHILEVIAIGDGPYLPTHCAQCGSELRWDGVDLECSDPDCDSINYSRLYNYISVISDIKGVSSKIINAIIKLSGWKYISDIYDTVNDSALDENLQYKPRTPWLKDLKNLEGFGDSSYDCVVQVLECLYSKPIDFTRWIVALSLNGIGWGTASKISKLLWDYLHQTPELLHWSFTSESGIGGAVEGEVAVNREWVQDLFDSMVAFNVQFIEPKDHDAEEFADDCRLKVCITGKLESGLTKSEFYEKYSDLVVESSVTDCEVLICNKPGSSKAKKAESLGKIIVSESRFIEDYKVVKS